MPCESNRPKELQSEFTSAVVAIYKLNHALYIINFLCLQGLSMSLIQHDRLNSSSKKQTGHSSTTKEKSNKKEEEKKQNCCN